ncbi:hypothetical protein D3C71_325500 [compost metagenome]
MKKLNLTFLTFVWMNTFVFSQYTLTEDAGFGVDYKNGYPGISTVYLSQQVSDGGPMAAPKCLEAIDEGYIAVTSKVAENGTTYSVFNVKSITTGINFQNMSLNNADVIGEGELGYCMVFDMQYSASEDKIYLVGRSIVENKGFVFRLKRKQIKYSHAFEFDPTFDTDGKYWFTDGTVTGVCLNGSEVIVCRDFSNAVYISRFSNSGALLTDFLVTSARATGNSTKVAKYPAMQNRFFVSGNEGTYPALWGIDLNTTNNTFSAAVSNSLNGSPEGTGQFKDFCFATDLQNNRVDIICVGSTQTEAYEASSAGSGIYVRYIGVTTSLVNLNTVATFKNNAGAIGNGNYSNVAGGGCSFKKIIPYGTDFILIGTSFVNNVWVNRVNVCALNVNGQVLNRIYVANQTSYSHLPDEFIIDPVNNKLLYAACAFQALVGKLSIQ